MYRKPVNKYKSAAAFKQKISKTKMLNVMATQRGGIRL